jgi:hypothetical protein
MAALLPASAEVISLNLFLCVLFQFHTYVSPSHFLSYVRCASLAFSFSPPQLAHAVCSRASKNTRQVCQVANINSHSQVRAWTDRERERGKTLFC